jgi:hypothetical protein
MACGKLDRKELAVFRKRAMQYDRVIEQALRDVQDLLLANLTPARHLPDSLAVGCLRTVLGASQVIQALERGNDTAPSFVLRAVNHIMSDKSQPLRVMLNRLWDIMDEPELNRALGIKQNSRMMIWRKKPPAR